MLIVIIIRKEENDVSDETETNFAIYDDNVKNIVLKSILLLYLYFNDDLKIIFCFFFDFIIFFLLK